MVSEVNPYAPPTADNDVLGEIAESIQLMRASRGARFLAAFTDGLLMMPFLGVGMYVASSLGFSVLHDKLSWQLVVWACMAPLTLYQWVLIVRTGQTLGKRWNKIKIFMKDGEQVDFLHGVVLRNWILYFIPVLVALVVPGTDQLMSLVTIVDLVIIFGATHRCLHDFIAGTQVLQLQRGGF
jgi:uncharacterized RDD family membrane protein YckC